MQEGGVSHLLAVDVHVLRVGVALALPGPVLALHVVVVALDSALVAGHGALHQHPVGVPLALRQRGPSRTVPAVVWLLDIF